MKWQRIRQMLIKEFIEMLRDPRMRAIIFIIPAVQTLLFGYAVTTDVRNIALAVYDQDRSQQSRDMISAFSESDYFNLVASLENDRQIDTLLDHGEAQAVLHIGLDFEKNLAKGSPAPLQVIVDGTDANTAGIIQDYIFRVTNQFAQSNYAERLSKAYPDSTFLTPYFTMQQRAWFNENLTSRNYFVPAILALLINLITLTLTCMAIVREKEIGTIEQMIVSPITKGEFILGKTVPFCIVGLIDVVIILLVSRYWFEIPIRGSLFLLFFSVALYLMTTLGIGLYISSVSQTQQQAMMSAFLFYLPTVMLSGFIFPIANMPQVIQWITYLNPLRYFLEIIRGVFLKGIGFSILWPNLLMLALIGILTLWQATKRFHKTLA